MITTDEDQFDHKFSSKNYDKNKDVVDHEETKGDPLVDIEVSDMQLTMKPGDR